VDDLLLRRTFFRAAKAAHQNVRDSRCVTHFVGIDVKAAKDGDRGVELST
jgi:hypothetical protein